MILTAALQADSIQLELLTGPLIRIYDPDGLGSMLFAVLAVAAQPDRDYTRQKTLEGQRAAAAKGNHGGRPEGLDEDMIIFARALHDNGVPVPESPPSWSSRPEERRQAPLRRPVYRALADDAATAAETAA